MYYEYYNHFMARCPALPGWAATRRNIHPLTYPDHHPTFISFFHLLRSIASSLFNLRAWQYFCTTSLQVLFGLPLGLEPSASYSIHFFTQSVSSFRNTCPYHRTETFHINNTIIPSNLPRSKHVHQRCKMLCHVVFVLYRSTQAFHDVC